MSWVCPVCEKTMEGEVLDFNKCVGCFNAQEDESRRGQSHVKTIVVLGIQRSATSLVAKGLERSGDVHMEPFSIQHWDNYEVYRINNQILAAAGGREFDPPPHKAIMEAGKGFENEIADYVRLQERGAEAAGYPFWGWKISNTGWTVDLWHPHLTEPHYVWIQRPPDVVAERLIHYDFLKGYHGKNTVEYARELVDEYNRRVIEFLTCRSEE